MTLHRRHLLLSAAAAGAAAALPGSGTAAPTKDGQLSKLLDDILEDVLQSSPETATSIGLDNGRRAVLRHRLSNASGGGRTHELQAYADRARRLRAFPRAGLSGRDLTTYDTVLYAMDLEAEGARFPYGGAGATPYVVDQQTGIVANGGGFLNSQHPVETADDAEAYLDRLGAYATVLDQETDRIREAAGRSVIAPEFLLTTALEQMKALRAQAAAETRLATSLSDRAGAKGIAGAWRPRAAEIVAGRVFPALDRQIAQVEALRSRASRDAGVWRLPDGAAYYAWALKVGTTTGLTAAEIHRMGLEQGAAIDAEMDPLLRSQGFTEGTVGERMGAMTADPRFLYPDTEAGRSEVIAFLNGRIAAIRPQLSKISRLELKAPVDVKAVPKEIEAGAGLGYMNFAALDGSRPAIYYVNLRDMRNWPKYTLTSLTMHEAIPGHAWQGAYLSERRGDIHPVFSVIGFNAYAEGWALYAEQLADEVGMYAEDPMSRLGYLQAQRFRAARLVADTGLHEQRWTREQAIAWLVAATGRSRPAVGSEIDRYCASPGQACGYKIGHGEIVRLRNKARAALGARFDLRDFNDAVVVTGGAPLSVLESAIDRYIAEARHA